MSRTRNDPDIKWGFWEGQQGGNRESGAWG